MKHLNFITLVTALFGTTSANAVLIASESFWTTGTETDPQYFEDNFPLSGNAGVVVGNSGFSASSVWNTNTGTIRPTNTAPGPGGGLEHSLVAGTVSPGATYFRVSHDRRADRGLSTTVPAGSSYFLSGIVRANSDNLFANNGDYFAMGFGSGISTGAHLGMFKNGSGELRLGAYGGGSTFDLGAASLDTNYMVVVELTANAGGADSFDAWVAADGGSLNPTLTGQSLETFSSVADLGNFVLQQATGDGNQVTRAWGDEIRLGTTMAAVVIPEPSIIALTGIAGIGLLLCRRR